MFSKLFLISLSQSHQHSDRHAFESLLLGKNSQHLTRGRKLLLTMTENKIAQHTHADHAGHDCSNHKEERQYQQRLPPNTHHEIRDPHASEHVSHSHQSAHRWADRHYAAD